MGKFDNKLKIGYSGVMDALAGLGRKDIALTSFDLVGKTLNINGVAKNPSSIPNWIGQFKTELDLVGHNFDQMIIERNEDDVIQFHLVADVEQAASGSSAGDNKKTKRK